MKSKAVLCTVLAASLLASQFAIAQGDSSLPRIYQDQRGNYNRDNDRNRRDDSRQQYRNDRNDRNDNRGNGNNYGHDQRNGRGAGPDHSFYRGDRLPPQYRSRQYVVEDWRGHRLSAPPRGYQWVQNGNDYILVAIATGVILNLLLGN
jgi:Ni/Co efflux regulator RcnB